MIERLSIDCGSIFVARSRGLSFESHPPNAEIYLILSGGTPAYTGSKTPDTIRNLPVGDYDYILKKQGYYDYTDTVTVSLGETSVTADLTPMPSSSSPLLVAAAALPIFAMLTRKSVIPITTGIVGGNVVVVKVGTSK